MSNLTVSKISGVLLSASLISLSRMLESEDLPTTSNIKVSNEINMRQFCQNMPKVGSYSSTYESEYATPNLTSRAAFWKLAHDLTIKHSHSKDSCGQKPQKIATNDYKCDMAVTAFGNLNKIIRIKSFTEFSTESIDTWSRPLNEVFQTNIRLEDVFHVINGHGMGIPFYHSAHILHGKLNYFLAYNTDLILDQRYALGIRDETINVLRMAVDSNQD